MHEGAIVVTEDGIEIDLSKTRSFEAGAIVMTILALPDGDEEARGGMIFSLCHLALRDQYGPENPDSVREQLLKPVYAFRTEAEIRRDLRTFDRRVRDRLIAADMAFALLKKKTGTLPPKLPKDLNSFSLNALSARAARFLPKPRTPGDERDQGNIETRIWRTSLPVIHLAMSLATFTQAWHRQGQDKVHPVRLLRQPDLIRWLIPDANTNADLIERSGVLGEKMPRLIRLRLVTA